MKKKMTQKGYKIKWIAVIGGIAVVAITVNILMFGLFQTVLSNFFQPKVERSAAVTQASVDLTETIAEGGIVLLKNEGNVLPLSGERLRVNVFGWSSTNPVYGGTGSGGVDVSKATNFFGGLKAAGIEYNQALVDFYQKFRSARPNVGMSVQDWTVPEPTMQEYEVTGIFASAKQFSNTALIYIARSGGEGADLPRNPQDLRSGSSFSEYADDIDPNRHYLELSGRERAMVERVTREFDNVVVIINANNVFEARWVDECAVDSVLWIGGPGESGFKAVGNILAGKASPSGRTADTWPADLTQDPIYGNFGHFAYTDEIGPSGYRFVNYAEGIYLGYRFYETFYLNNEAGYRAAVQYPFGYGLSYTAFTQQMGEIRKEGNRIAVDVTVTNTGRVAGKEVVQIYHTPPYYEGGIEKAHVVLTAFGKTGTLQPGASQTLTLTFSEEDLASFDAGNAGAYILEAGDYEIKLMRNAHELIESKTHRVQNAVVYSGSNKRSSDSTAASRIFAFAENDIPYLSRANNFANYQQATAPAADRAMTEWEKAAVQFQIPQNPNDQTPKTGVKGNLKLADMAGKSYDDPAWEALLDQLTLEEMSNLIAMGGYQTKPVRSIDKPATIDIDGPQGLSTFMGASIKGGAYPTAVVVASTWDIGLARERGEMIGNEALEMGVAGWYGPAMNIHRSAFSGRNFEYYSEDGFLSGKIAQAEVAGAKNRGLYAYIKHFALNDQERNRTSWLCTWAAEQTIREIYLKPFELSVKEGGASAVMSSFNFIGGIWAGGCYELLTTVLRGEWGFRGMVITDYFIGRYMDSDKAIYGGTDLMLSTLGVDGAKPDESDTPSGRIRMRTSSKNILYTVANSNAMYSIDRRESMLREVGGSVYRANPVVSLANSMGTQPWMLVAWGVDILVAALLALLIVLKKKKFNRLYGAAQVRLTREG